MTEDTDSTEPTADEVYETYYPNVAAAERFAAPVVPPTAAEKLAAGASDITYAGYYPEKD